MKVLWFDKERACKALSPHTACLQNYDGCKYRANELYGLEAVVLASRVCQVDLLIKTCPEGKWGPDCSLDDRCYYHGDVRAYRGGVGVTEGGLACQRWDMNWPHALYGAPMPLEGARAAGAACRAMEAGQQPWCFTTDPATRRAPCDVYECGRRACGQTSFRDERGVVASPSFPDRYPAWVRCHYDIRAPEGHIIELHFGIFDVDEQVSCRTDSLTIESKKFCGEQHDLVYRSKGHTLDMIFEADGSESGQGFYISYSFLRVDEVWFLNFTNTL